MGIKERGQTRSTFVIMLAKSGFRYLPNVENHIVELFDTEGKLLGKKWAT